LNLQINGEAIQTDNKWQLEHFCQTSSGFLADQLPKDWSASFEKVSSHNLLSKVQLSMTMTLFQQHFHQQT